MAHHSSTFQEVQDETLNEGASISPSPNGLSLASVVGIIVSVIAIASFYLCLWKYSYNFPYFDDFEVILDFLNRFAASGGLSERLRLLFEQHSEHRVVFTRSIALLEYSVFGRINFQSFMLIGHTSLVAILILFAKAVWQKSKIPLLYFAPVALLLFNFRYFETSFWAMTALQNLWVLAFAFFAFYFLFQPARWAIWVAAVFGVVATFTSGNGMLTFIAGAGVLALNRQLLTRKGLIWSVTGITVIVSYLTGYVKPAQHPEVLQPLINNPIPAFGYALAFLGGMFTENVVVAVIVGSVLVLITAGLTFQKYFRQNPTLYCLIVFLIMTAGLAGVSRSGFGIEQALASRYMIVSTLLVVSCFAAMISLRQSRLNTGWGIAILIVSLYFHYNTYGQYLPAKKADKAEFEKDFRQINEGKLTHFNFGWPPLDARREFPRQVLRTADSLGYFPFEFRDEAEVLASLPVESTGRSAHHFDRFEKRGPIVTMSGWGLIRGVDPDDVIPVLCFKDKQKNPVKYMVLQAAQRKDVAEQFADDGLDHTGSGFETVFNANEIEPGNYTLSLFLVTPDFKIEIDAGPTRLGQ